MKKQMGETKCQELDSEALENVTGGLFYNEDSGNKKNLSLDPLCLSYEKGENNYDTTIVGGRCGTCKYFVYENSIGYCKKN